MSKPEVLLLAAVDYSSEKLVVHVGPKPPGGRLHSYASAQGKRIMHIPIGSLSPVTLKKIRVVHLLVGQDSAVRSVVITRPQGVDIKLPVRRRAFPFQLGVLVL